MKKLVIATGNRKKFKEIKKILAKVPLKVKCLNDFDKAPKIVEDGRTFFANAKKKAVAASLFYDALAVGEDSGLEVKALGGKPGIYSARFSGKGVTDLKNIDKLLGKLKGLPASKRGARFFCCAVLACKGRVIKKFEGSINGRILDTLKGSSGFGYDPVFYVPSLKKTLAQVPLRTKNKLSHRYKAISSLSRYLRKCLKKTR